MVTEIRIYIEGDKKLREGFGKFLERPRGIARRREIKWNLVLCGSRNSTYENYKKALEDHADAYNNLLVDSEAPVGAQPWAHLKSRDDWERPHACGEDHCQLMAQTMEAWFLADPESLQSYYGQSFNPNPLPPPENVEQIDKSRVYAILADCTKATSKKRYHKTNHAPKLLGILNEAVVRRRAPHCQRLFNLLERLIGSVEGE